MLQLNGLSKEQIKTLAREFGFTKRNSGKFDPPDFLSVFCLKSQVGSPSYNDLAIRIEVTYGITITKQALWKRVNELCVLFFQAILAQIIKNRILQEEVDYFEKMGKYNRILIQDSTIIKIPLRLFGIFSGVSNGNNAVCNARIQGVYDLISGRFIDFSIDSYSKNDLLAAPELRICQGDLVLRDRGYSTISEIERHVSNGADCIYRHKQSFVYLHPESGLPVNLMTLLRKKNHIDMIVCLNNKQQTKVRLLAEPVTKEIADNRRQKAKKEMKGHNPSVESLELMGYTIFITTIMDQDIDFDQIRKMYSLRWKIEIIFKIWKSHMNFDKVHNVSNNQLLILLTARLIMIVLKTHLLYVTFCLKVKQYCGRDLSMMKFIKYTIDNQEVVGQLLKAINNEPENNKELLNKLVRYCAYDKRKRMNMKDLEKSIFLS